MKQIKTIMRRSDNSEDFDKAVNAALAEGWKLVKREVIQGVEGQTLIFHRMLYAELERETVEAEREDQGAEIPSRERKCHNCKHRDKHVELSPCNNCYSENKWEPRQ